MNPIRENGTFISKLASARTTKWVSTTQAYFAMPLLHKVLLQY